MQDMYNENFSTSDGGFDNTEAPNNWGNDADWGQPNDSWGFQGDTQDDWGQDDNWQNTNEQNDWGSQNTTQQGWGNDIDFSATQPKFNTMESAPEDFDNKYEKQFDIKNPVADKVFSMKTVLSVLLVGVIILIGVFVLLNRVHINKKVSKVAEKVVDAEVAVTSPEAGQTKQEALKQALTEDSSNVSEVEQPTDVNNQVQSTEQGAVSLLNIDANTPIDYSVPVLEASGLVSAKKRYLQGSQVIYCLEVTIAVGSTQQTVNYYCNYASFNAVKEGDVVLIKYQQVSNSFISISEITK